MVAVTDPLPPAPPAPTVIVNSAPTDTAAPAPVLKPPAPPPPFLLPAVPAPPPTTK